MNKKIYYFIILLAVIFFVINIILEDNSYSNFENELINGEYSELRFITSTKNVVVILGKFLDNTCTFLVNGIFLIIEKAFSLIFGF